jgi:predicted nucleotidyltransferase
VNGGNGAVQRKLKQLTDLGLILRSHRGNQVVFQANRRSPIFRELKSLVAKTVGVRDVLRSALASLAGEIAIAFVYGSVARQTERASSDADLMVLGRSSFTQLVAGLGPAQKALGREINPTVFPVSEFQSKFAAKNHFLRSVMADKKLFVLGSEDDLAKLVAK